MANVSVSEADFTTVAGAAIDAWRRGDKEAARALDKIARKINAALAQNVGKAIARKTSFPRSEPVPFTWRDVPSVLEPLMNNHR